MLSFNVYLLRFPSGTSIATILKKVALKITFLFDLLTEMDPHVTPDVQHLSRTSIHTPVEALPPVKSSTDRRALHRTEAHTNICLICQLPKWSHEYPTSEAVCRCKEPEGSKSLMRRFTITGHEGHNYEHIASPIQVGQRRHSLMMARLNNSYGEYKPHPPERGGTGK